MTPSLSAPLADYASEPVHVPVGESLLLPGTLALPPHPAGLVLFAHGSGSSRLSPRNRFVADRLFQTNLGWLMFDLLTEAESRIRGNVFDIALLADRLRHAADWVSAYAASRDLALGYFGASTGAAAALVAAVGDPRIRAIVSRGGRPDLAGALLRRVQAPTLLIVGGADAVVLDLNVHALQELPGVRDMVVVPRATHLFEEPGALEQVATHAAEWFRRYLSASESRASA